MINKLPFILVSLFQKIQHETTTKITCLQIV